MVALTVFSSYTQTTFVALYPISLVPLVPSVPLRLPPRDQPSSLA